MYITVPLISVMILYSVVHSTSSKSKFVTVLPNDQIEWFIKQWYVKK